MYDGFALNAPDNPRTAPVLICPPALHTPRESRQTKHKWRCSPEGPRITEAPLHLECFDNRRRESGHGAQIRESEFHATRLGKRDFILDTIY